MLGQLFFTKVLTFSSRTSSNYKLSEACQGGSVARAKRGGKPASIPRSTLSQTTNTSTVIQLHSNSFQVPSSMPLSCSFLTPNSLKPHSNFQIPTSSRQAITSQTLSLPSNPGQSPMQFSNPIQVPLRSSTPVPGPLQPSVRRLSQTLEQEFSNYNSESSVVC